MLSRLCWYLFWSFRYLVYTAPDKWTAPDSDRCVYHDIGDRFGLGSIREWSRYLLRRCGGICCTAPPNGIICNITIIGCGDGTVRPGKKMLLRLDSEDMRKITSRWINTPVK